MDTPAFRFARTGEEPEQKRLWKTVFGDSETYINAFYNNMYSPNRMALAMDGGVLAAMCALLPVCLRLPDGAKKKAAYLYALATDPDRRGRGIAHGLMAWSDARLREAGMAGVCTVPAHASLHALFASAGYEEGFSLRVADYAACDLPPAATGDTVQEIDAQEYDALRESLLGGQFYVAYDTAYLKHQQAVCRLSGGGLYLIETCGTRGLAAAERGPDGVMVRELLLPPALVPQGVAVLAGVLPAPRYRCRMPCGDGTRVAFGMMKWFDGTPAQADGYLAFALD